MNTKDLDFTQEQLEQFAQENNDIYFNELSRIQSDSRYIYCVDEHYDLEESFWW